MDLKEQIQKMLNDFKVELRKDFEVSGEDGKTIKLTDLFKMYPEVAAKYSELEQRFTEMETKVRERKFAGSVPGLEDEKQKFSFLRAFRAISTRNWDKAGFEQEIFRTTRAMSTTDDAAGGYIVPIQAIPDFIEMLRSETVCVALGASLLDNLTGAPVYMPKQTGGCTVYWIGENSAITASDLAFGQLELRPRKAAALVAVSNELVNMASPGAEALIRADLAASVGLAMDTKYLRGTGASGEPLGIANSADINTVTMGSGSGAVPDWVTPWPDMEYELSIDKALRGRLGFLFHPAIKKALKKLRNPYYSGDTGGEYPLLPLTDAQIEAAIGYPFKTTSELPINLTTGDSSNCTEIYFGNWRELLIGMWSGLSIAVSNEAGDSFAYDQTWFRIIARTDCALRHPQSFCLSNSARIASS